MKTAEAWMFYLGPHIHPDVLNVAKIRAIQRDAEASMRKRAREKCQEGARECTEDDNICHLSDSDAVFSLKSEVPE